MMHTLWLASWYPHRGDPFNGDFIQRHALALATQMPVTVVHVVKEGPRAETVTRTGALTERISYFPAPATPISALNKVLSQVRTFRLYQRAFRAHVAENGRPELIHVHVCMNAGLFALWLKARYQIPYVVTEHYSVYIPGSTGTFADRPFLYRFTNRLVLRRAIGVTSVSGFLLRCMRAVTPIKRPEVTPNVVNTKIFYPATAGANIPFRFVHVSTFLRHKNVPAILDAFALLRAERQDWTLELVGPAGEDIRAYARQQALSDHLHWTGEIPYTSAGDRLREADAFVMFSRFENQPCVISEALCCGIPVIASAVGGIPEVLNPDNGVLVPPGDVSALAVALHILMERRGAYDKAAIAREAAAQHGYEGVGAQFVRYYKRALDL
jgi:glycosyltransferase involved in cell wall biosynthesis